MEEKETSDQEEVKTWWDDTSKIEVTQEQFDKLQEIERNKTIALKQEREANKSAMARLQELEAKEKEIQEKEMKKKGQYEELLKEKEDLITSLTEKANSYDEYLTQKQKDTETKLNSLMKTIPKEVLEENSYILEDLKEDKKIIFLEKLLNNSKKETFDTETKDGEKNPNNKNDLDINEAKWKWFDNFLWAMIKSNIK